MANFYHLPSSPSYKCLDRFSLHPSDSVTEDENDHVPFWPILECLLSQPLTSTSALVDLLETISVTLAGTTGAAGDHGLLRQVMDKARSESFFEYWPQLAEMALQLPILFPEGQLPVLGRNAQTSSLSLTRRQTACLVVHQFLRTLRPPEWRDDGTHDFGIWYHSEQRQESAVRAYLNALFTYFEDIVRDTTRLDDANWTVEYTLCSVEDDEFRAVMDRPYPLAEIEITIVYRYEVSPTSLGLPGGAAVVSANKHIGFGQSATQEEVHVGTSPEACPTVLITPPLETSQVLVVRGAQAMVNITGQRRDIQVEQMPVPDGGDKIWKERRMLFMDALELDLVDSHGEDNRLPDLVPGNTDREIRKAYTAFSSGGFGHVRTGLWGCGAFCGNPAVKVLLLWCAASMARVKLAVFCDEQNRRIGQGLRDLVSGVLRRASSTVEIMQLLERDPESLVFY